MPDNEEIIYHAVEKDGAVTAIWEMHGRKHLRTIDPRSEEGRRILGAYTTDEVEHAHAAEQGEAAKKAGRRRETVMRGVDWLNGIALRGRPHLPLNHPASC